MVSLQTKSPRITEPASNQEEVAWRRAHGKLWGTGYHGNQGGSEKGPSHWLHFWSKVSYLSRVQQEPGRDMIDFTPWEGVFMKRTGCF